MESRVSSSKRKRLKDKKITIYRADIVQDENGIERDTWKPIHAGKLWAYVRQLSGEEVFSAGGKFAHDSVLFVINWRNDLDTFDQIEYKGNWYDIQRIDTYEGYKADLALTCNSVRAPSRIAAWE